VRSALLAGALLAALAALSCSDPTGPRPSGVSARARWNATRPAAYVIDQDIVCFCLGYDTTARVTVAGTTIIDVSNAETGAPRPRPEWRGYLSVDGLFEAIARAERDSNSRVEAVYDSVYGYPREVYLDLFLDAVDDEVHYRTANLRPYLPPPGPGR
jgi:hypothetical protein